MKHFCMMVCTSTANNFLFWEVLGTSVLEWHLLAAAESEPCPEEIHLFLPDTYTHRLTSLPKSVVPHVFPPDKVSDAAEGFAADCASQNISLQKADTAAPVTLTLSKGRRLLLWESLSSLRELAYVNEALAKKIAVLFMDGGVEIPFPSQVIIDPRASIGVGTKILPGCALYGSVTIGENCVIGPHTTIKSCSVGSGTSINASLLTDSTVGNNCHLGPFMQLRPGCVLGDGVKIGDFVELKNASVGNKTSIAHLTYLGDCDVGQNCNFGCGVVTANYNGIQKFRSVIEDRAFIGCNTNLISPVHIGEGAYTAAGVTVTEDVPAGALVVGRPKQEIKPHWADEHIAFQK